MNDRVIITVAALTAGLLTGCGSSRTDKGPANAGDMCRSYSSSISSKLAACNPTALPEVIVSLLISRLFDCQTFQAAQDAGRVTFDQAKAKACVDAVSAMSCAEFLAGESILPGACGEAITPKVPAGGACYSSLSYECVAGKCSIPTAACYVGGTCVAYATLGQSCATATCGPGLSCGAGSLCVTAPVTTILGAGGNCAAANTICNDGLYCASGTSLCTARQPAGTACTAPAQCLLGTYCDAGTSTCTAWLKLGDTCVPGAMRCGGKAYCGAAGKCVPLPVLGGDCTPVGGELVYCQNSWCAPPVAPSTTPKCTAPAAPGAACDTGNLFQCGPGYACNVVGAGTVGTCGRNYCGLF